MNTENRSRFVLLCQQALACAVVVAVAAPAAGIVTLDIVAPLARCGSDRSAVAGALVASAPVEPDVREVPLTETHAQAASNRKQSVDPEGLSHPAHRAGRARPPTRTRPSAAPETVHGFGSIGVTWDGNDVVDHDDISIEVRTLQAGDVVGLAGDALRRRPRPRPGQPGDLPRGHRRGRRR